jgi:dihydrofolate reductase
MINMIWAMDKNWLVGKDNKLPWHFKEDLIYYKSKTQGKTVLMGDNSYYSLKSYYKDKPLPYGKIYVASLLDLKLDDAGVINDVISFLKNFPKEEELWVVGGATIYKFSLPYADNLYITHVDGEYEGDAYFPKFDLENEFKLISSKVSNNLNFAVYERV